MLLLLLLFSSVCLPALSDTQCVLPLLMTLGNDSNNSGDCQNAGASECTCDDSEPTYIGSLGQCGNPYEPINECNFTISFFEGELQCNASNDQIFIERDNIDFLRPDFADGCRLNFSCNSVQHCLVFKWNGTLNLTEVCSTDSSGSEYGKGHLFCPVALMSKAALLAPLTPTPTSTTVTMTTPTGTQGVQTGTQGVQTGTQGVQTGTQGVQTGTRGTPTGDSNTGSEMRSPGTSDYIYIALGGGIAGGILCLVILLLLVVVCCLAAKMIRNERQMRLKLSEETQPKTAVDNSTYSGEGQTDDYEQKKLSSTDETEDMYDTVDDERTNADKQSTSHSHGSEDMSENYTYVSSDSCKKRPTIREAACSLATTAEFGEYSEITEEQQTSQFYESIDRPKIVQPNSQPSLDQPTTPRIAKLPGADDGYSHLQHTKFTNRAPERYSMPLPLPTEKYSQLDVRSKASEARHSDCYSIELSSFHSDSQPQMTSQQVEVFENVYSLLEEGSPSSQDGTPPLPPPFHPELSRPESNNDDGIYAEVTSAQDVQLGEGNYSCQEPLYDEAIPDKEAFYDDIPSLEV